MGLAAPGAQAEETITLGAMLALSGNQASFQQPIVQGIRLAVDDINKAGGINGKRLEIIIEDSGGTAQGGVAAFNKLARVDGIPAFISLSSPVVAALVPLVERNKVVMLDIATLSPGIWNATPDRNYSFSIYPKVDFEAKQSARYILDRGFKSVAVLAIGTETGQVPARVFSEEFTRLGGTIVSEDFYPASTTDFSSYLNKIAQSSPDLVILACNDECGLVVRQAAENGLQFNWFGSATMVGGRFLELAGSTAEGALASTAGWDPNSSNPLTVEFIKRYTETYNDAPTVYSAYGYDGVHILANAAADADGDTNKIADAMRATNHLGVTGQTKIQPDGLAHKPIYINELRNGVFEIIETLSPEQ